MKQTVFLYKAETVSQSDKIYKINTILHSIALLSIVSFQRLVRYWFVLFEQKDLLAFLYFLDEDHYLERKKNEGFIRIDDSTSIDVVPEFMGRKNSFCITTPRNKFYLVSESRWVFAPAL